VTPLISRIPMRSTFARAAALAAALALASAARASPADTVGLFSRGIATAGTQTAAADDAGAAYYNPAGLALAAQDGDVSIQLGYAAALPFVDVNRTGSAARQARFPTRLPESAGLLSFGAVFPLGGKLENKAAIGLAVYHPQDKLIRVEAHEPRNPHFLRLQSATDREVIALSFAARPHPMLSLGVGANMLAALGGRIDFDMELFEKRVERRDLIAAMRTTPTLVAGAMFTPNETIRVGLAYRQANLLEVTLPTTVGLGDVGTLFLDVRSLMHYTPHELALGASVRPSEDLRVSFDLRWHLWSLAPNPAVGVRVELRGEVPEGLGLDRAFNFTAPDPATGFANTLTPSVAAEYRLPGGGTWLRAGYALRPTFVPNQVQSSSNWLDNTAHVLGFGASIRFLDPLEVFALPLHLDLGGQLQALQRREVRKLQDNDPVGNYDFGGVVLAFSGALRYEF
jgi:long-subunit fatty acid transport protein